MWAVMALAFCLSCGGKGGGAVEPAAAPDEGRGAAMAFAELFPKVVLDVVPSVVSITTTRKVTRPQLEMPPLDMNPFRSPDGFPETPWPQEKAKEFTERSLGSGFVVRNDGWVVTNNHVIGNVPPADIKVVFYQPETGGTKEYKPTEIHRDPNTDLAILKVDGGELKALPLGDSSKVEVGQWVIAVGSPLGFGNSVTAGIISAVTTRNRFFGGSEPGTFQPRLTPFSGGDYLQTDASINQGNSGGPLVNLRGEVIGMNTLIVSPSDASAGLGFATPSSTIKRVTDELVSRGKVVRGYLGVQMIPDLRQFNDEEASELFHETSAARVLEMYHVKTTDKGVFIGGVMPASPAEQAGLQAGDLVVEMNGAAIQNSYDLKNRVEFLKPGAEVKLKVMRKGKPVELKVAVGEQPQGEAATAAIEGRYSSDRLGMTVQGVTPAIARALGLEKAEGVVVTDVVEGGPAVRAGIRANDLIMRVGKQEIKALSDFTGAMEGLRKEKDVALFVKHGGQAAKWMEVTMGEATE